MKYRILRKGCWWSSIFDTYSPKYLYYDFQLEHFEVGAYVTAKKHKWEFNREEVDNLRKEKNFDNEFLIENIREKGDKL